MNKNKRFVSFAWFLVFYNILVILWGAVVRATGSGAGCGSHWPLCNGVVMPVNPRIETIIEFTHRLMSGLDGLLVLLLFIWAFLRFVKGSPVRLGASLSLLFIITESLVGAGLVRFEWVAQNASFERVIVMGVHLINTFLLLASLALTAWWASGGSKIRLKERGSVSWSLLLAFIGVLLIGVTGAMTALGDTLFPAESLAEGIRQDFLAQSHFLIRLRVFHPLIAILVGLYVVFIAGLMGMMSDRRGVKRMSLILVILVVMQLAAGLVNLVLKAPVAMQIIHLLLAELLWLSLVLLAAQAFEILPEEAADQEAVSPPQPQQAG